MNLRQKILLMFSLTIVLTVASVGWAVAVRVRVLFDAQDRDRMAALVNQFVREYARRGEDISNRVERVARDARVARLGNEVTHGNDTSGEANAASGLAREYGLDFLELTEPDGTVLSSAQWPAHVGVQDESAAVAEPAPYAKREPLAGDKSEIGVFANRAVQGSDSSAGLGIVGGERLDGSFLSGISAPAGSMVYLYRNLTPEFVEANLIGAGGGVANAARYRGLIDQVRSTGGEVTSEILRRNSEEQSVALRAVPLKAVDGSVAAVLLVANSRDALIEAQEHIRAVTYGVAAIGILFAVMVSLWIAASVSRPVEQLAAGAREITAGSWHVEVPVRSSADEIATLGVAFNAMSRALVRERERLVQWERVAAWRELAGRLAHELQDSVVRVRTEVENVAGVKQVSHDRVGETGQGDAGVLTQEIANLSRIGARLDEFANLPASRMSRIDLREIAGETTRFYGAMLREQSRPVGLISEMPPQPLMIDGDPELLRDALSKLVLYAIEHMGRPGRVTVAAGQADGFVRFSVSDTGQGMTEEECARLFLPDASARDGAQGSGMALVQAVIADHHGTIVVESFPGRGSTFMIELPAAAAEAEEEHV